MLILRLERCAYRAYVRWPRAGEGMSLGAREYVLRPRDGAGMPLGGHKLDMSRAPDGGTCSFLGWNGAHIGQMPAGRGQGRACPWVHGNMSCGRGMGRACPLVATSWTCPAPGTEGDMLVPRLERCAY